MWQFGDLMKMLIDQYLMDGWMDGCMSGCMDGCMSA